MALDQEFEEQEIDSPQEEGIEMTFIEHLEELRWHVIRAVGAIFVFTIVAFIYIQDIFKYIILGPKTLISGRTE